MKAIGEGRLAGAAVAEDGRGIVVAEGRSWRRRIRVDDRKGKR